MKKLLLGLLLFATTALADESRLGTFASAYDVDSSSFTYCVTTGQGGASINPADIPGTSTIKTTGSSVTIDAVVSGALPLRDLAVGDDILVRRPDGTVDFRIIATKASGDQVTVDLAVDWSAGLFFTYRKVTCGTGLTAGWIDVSDMVDFKLVSEFNQGDIDALDVRLECKDEVLDNQPIVVYPKEGDGCGLGGTISTNFCDLLVAGVGILTRLDVPVTGQWGACRIGVKFATTDTAETTTNLERVTTYVVGKVD